MEKVDSVFSIAILSEYRHKKTGGIYYIKCLAILERTQEEVVVYCGVRDGAKGIWVRPIAEFSDGRFEKLVDRKSCGCEYTETCICDDPDFC